MKRKKKKEKKKKKKGKKKISHAAFLVRQKGSRPLVAYDSSYFPISGENERKGGERRFDRLLDRRRDRLPVTAFQEGKISCRSGGPHRDDGGLLQRVGKRGGREKDVARTVEQRPPLAQPRSGREKKRGKGLHCVLPLFVSSSWFREGGKEERERGRRLA